jgi:hypothetical protein
MKTIGRRSLPALLPILALSACAAPMRMVDTPARTRVYELPPGTRARADELLCNPGYHCVVYKLRCDDGTGLESSPLAKGETCTLNGRPLSEYYFGGFPSYVLILDGHFRTPPAREVRSLHQRSAVRESW